jgi:glycosyltransferase involved in cell wall biosynthesis
MRPRLSVISICKDEKHNLIKFLSSVGLVADEIVIVDTGSKDGTPAALKKLGFSEKGRGQLKLRHFKWNNNFSDARNFSLRHATGEWVLWMDLDDRLSASAPQYINALKKHDPIQDTNSHIYPNLAGEEKRASAFGFQIASQTEEEGAYVRFIQARMFPNIRGISWRKPIHESLHESLAVKNVNLVPIPECVIIHLGYADPMLKQHKAMRNAKILESFHEESYERFYQLGDAYFAMGTYDLGVINYYRARSLAVTDLQKNSATERIILGRCCMGEMPIAREEYTMLPSGVPEQMFWEAEFAYIDKDYDKAGPIYEAILEIKYEPQSMNSYLDAYKARAIQVLTAMQEKFNKESEAAHEEGSIRTEGNAVGLSEGNQTSETAEAGSGSKDP